MWLTKDIRLKPIMEDGVLKYLLAHGDFLIGTGIINADLMRLVSIVTLMSTSKFTIWTRLYMTAMYILWESTNKIIAYIESGNSSSRITLNKLNLYGHLPKHIPALWWKSSSWNFAPKISLVSLRISRCNIVSWKTITL